MPLIPTFMRLPRRLFHIQVIIELLPSHVTVM